jgi:hypothetical protein
MKQCRIPQEGLNMKLKERLRSRWEQQVRKNVNTEGRRNVGEN